ncbi:MAG: HDOD domain-containing protein [Opitutus sp.]
MRKETVACLPEIVKLMRTLSRNSSEVSVPELANVIQKDPIIFMKVLSAANTLGYNPGRVPVTTVDQAIHIIGYERIRTLAMSLLLVEQTSRTQGAEEQREVAVLALTAGAIAQGAAKLRPMINPDEAFVCASLRSFGRIIMVTCMLEEYRAAQQLAEARPSDEAFRETFGLTPLELGYQLLMAAELPEEILTTLKALPPETIANLSTSPSEQMLALTDFAAQLAELALAPQLTAAEFAVQSKLLASRYAHLLPDLAEQIAPLVDTATAQLNQFISTLHIKSLPPRLLNRLRCRSEQRDPASVNPTPIKPVESAPVTSSPTENSITPADSPSTITDNEAAAAFCWQTEIDRLSALARSGVGSRGKLLSAIADSVQRGFAAPECLLFSKPPGAALFELTHGRGGSFASLGQRARLRSTDRTVFGVCLSRGENVVIHRAEDPKIVPYLPDWLRAEHSLSSFVLLPLTAEGVTDGLVLAGWPTARRVVIAPEQAKLIRSLLAACVSARCAA